MAKLANHQAMVARLEDWAAATRREWGDDLYYPPRAAFVQMQGGSVKLPPAEESRIEAIGRAVWLAGPVHRLVLHAHYRRRQSCREIARTLTKRTGRQVWMREVVELLASAVARAEREYLALD